MQLARPAIAVDPRLFGRGRARDAGPVQNPASGVAADLKLFAVTFLAGFVFVSVLIG
jgi:hypothetical protein